MILLFGVTTKVTVRATVWLVCHFCGFSAPQRVLEQVRRLTLFWIPLIPLSRSVVNECGECGHRVPLSAEQARRAEAWESWQSTH